MSAERTREELEARLKGTSSSIRRRLARLESVIPGSGRTLPKLPEVKRTSTWGVAVGVGLWLGWRFVKRSRRHREGSYEDGVAHLADRLETSISEHLDRKRPPSEAVRRALLENPPVIQMAGKEEGLFSGAAKELLRSSSSMLVTELGRWLEHRLVEKKEHPEAD